MHSRVIALTIVVSTVSGCTVDNGDHPTAPGVTVAAASFPQTSTVALSRPTTIVTVASTVPSTTSPIPAGRNPVMAPYTRYVAARSKSATTDGASGSAAYRLAHREAAPEIVTVHAVRFGAGCVAVEERADDTERLVVLTLSDDAGSYPK